MTESSFREMASKVMVQVARELRHRQTNAEVFLWEHLRDRRLDGKKFRRQHPIASTSYVADFYNYEARLVIELDGSIHDEPQQQAADFQRQQDIEALDYKLLRFRNDRILGDIEGVLTEILIAINTQPSQTGF